MPALQGIFQQNAQILSFKEAFNIKGVGRDKWMTPRKIGAFILTSETAVHFPLSREGTNNKDSIDILKALVGHPALDVAQAEMDRLKDSDRKLIEKMTQKSPLLKAVADNLEQTFPFRVVVRAAGGERIDCRSYTSLSERDSPTFVKDIVAKIARSYDIPEDDRLPYPVATDELPPRIQAIVNSVSIEPK